jgi:hypothetical protein
MIVKDELKRYLPLVDDLDLAWAAGFLEGEGSFFRQSRGDIVVKATQVDRESLDRLSKLFAGSVTYDSRVRDRGTRQPQWQWRLDGRRAVELMFILFPLMTERRQEQITKALEEVE